MTADRWTITRFKMAARGHLHAASCVFETEQGQQRKPETRPATVPASAVYLAHVALECAIKARLLERNGCASVKDLERKDPKAFKVLFRSTKGHDLPVLAKKIRLENFVKTYGKEWSEDTCWERLSHSDRPYSLRYGAEEIAETEAQEDVARSRELADVLLSGITGKKRR